MADIFIGYAKEDQTRVKPLARALQAQGWSVFWDMKIPPGETWRSVLHKELAAVKCIVVIWSRTSVSHEWVIEEAEEGKNRNVLIPVLMDPIGRDDIPLGFRQRQWADLTQWKGGTEEDGFQQLVESISRLAGPPPIQEPKGQEKEKPKREGPKTDDFFSVIGKVVVPLAAVAIVAFIIMWLLQPQPPPPPTSAGTASAPTQAGDSGRAQIAAIEKSPKVLPKEEPSSQRASVTQPADPKTEKPKAPRAEKVASVPSFSLPKQTPKPKEMITGIDGAPMVLVPAGEFMMGSNDGEADEKPERRVTLEAFYMDKYEVSTKLYAAFLQATGRAQPDDWSKQVALMGSGDRPVVNVTWHDADAYCRQYGKRLPTEAEWEKAARGTDGRKYPWGNEEPTNRHAVFATKWNGYRTLATVESYEAGKSPYGLYHMAGNVWERTSSDYENIAKVLRGGSWGSNARYVRSAARDKLFPSLGFNIFGFRCAQDAS